MPGTLRRWSAPPVWPPTAVLCGDVAISPEAWILFSAVLTAEDGRVEVGARCVVMEHALVRGRAGHPARLGDDVLVGPHAHINGRTATQPDRALVAGAPWLPGPSNLRQRMRLGSRRSLAAGHPPPRG